MTVRQKAAMKVARKYGDDPRNWKHYLNPIYREELAEQVAAIRGNRWALILFPLGLIGLFVAFKINDARTPVGPSNWKPPTVQNSGR